MIFSFGFENKDFMKRFFSFFFLSCISVVVFAQPANNKKPAAKPNRSSTFGDFSLNLGIPMYSFDETSSSTPFGINFNIIHQPTTRIPILFGGGLAYLHAGGNRVDRLLTADITAGNILIDQLSIPLEFRMNNHIINGHGLVRFQAPGKYFKPYIDLVGGFNYLWTGTAVYDRSPERFFATEDNGLITRKTQESSLTWAAGFGAGAFIYLSSDLFLNINATYMGGGWAKYYDRNQISNWDVQLNVNGVSDVQAGSLGDDALNVNAFPKNSRTDMIYAQIGVGFYLDGNSGGSSNGKARIGKNAYVNPNRNGNQPYRQPRPNNKR
jgi:hypothetical protein